jgi:hypothetical protein
LKSIVLKNLFGVDLMDEAVEICRLRLYLKLVAQVERFEDLEPLPDLDFNIRAGNTLVGYATSDQMRAALRSKVDTYDTLSDLEEKARAVEMLFDRCQSQRMGGRGTVTAGDKEQLRDSLRALETELNGHLAGEYGVDAGTKASFEAWLASHRPFHWYVDFHGIMRRGGFDVILGNPPYLEYSKTKHEYGVHGFETRACGNLYALTLERSLGILGSAGVCGMIVPLSLSSTERMRPLQQLVDRSARSLWLSFFDVYPCKLFEGAKQRLCIALLSAECQTPNFFTTRYNRWKPEERQSLLACLAFSPSRLDTSLSAIPKLGSEIANSIMTRIGRHQPAVYANSSQTSFYVHRIPYNYVKAVSFVPHFWNGRDGEKRSEDYWPYSLRQRDAGRAVLAALNSNTFFWWWYTLFEGYHCGRHEVTAFPIGLDCMDPECLCRLGALADELMFDVSRQKKRRTAQYGNTGWVEYDEFFPRLSKGIIDKIDIVLAKHYGFTDEELDFLINYDIKYRMGAGRTGG